MDSMVLTDGDKSWETWMAALSGALAVALVGALPILFLPNEHNQSQSLLFFFFFFLVNWIDRCLEEKPFLEFFLSISVGSQLSDVFLHLLPEAFASSSSSSSSLSIGLWTLTGFLLFFLLEQIFLDDSSSSTTTTIKVRFFILEKRRERRENRLDDGLFESLGEFLGQFQSWGGNWRKFLD